MIKQVKRKTAGLEDGLVYLMQITGGAVANDFNGTRKQHYDQG